MRSFLAIVFAALCGIAHGQLTITGPEQVNPGDCVTLESSVANCNWIVPDDVREYVRCGAKLIIRMESGVAPIVCYGASEDGTLCHDVHTVAWGEIPTIGEDPPPVAVSGLQELSKSQADALNDPFARNLLAEELAHFRPGVSDRDSLALFEQLFRRAMAKRPRDRQTADWYNGWFKAFPPKLRNVEDWAATVEDIRTGLTL